MGGVTPAERRLHHRRQSTEWCALVFMGRFTPPKWSLSFQCHTVSIPPRRESDFPPWGHPYPLLRSWPSWVWPLKIHQFRVSKSGNWFGTALRVVQSHSQSQSQSVFSTSHQPPVLVAELLQPRSDDGMSLRDHSLEPSPAPLTSVPPLSVFPKGDGGPWPGL